MKWYGHEESKNVWVYAAWNFLEFCELIFCELTIMATREAAREAKDFATGEAKAASTYCSFMIYPFPTMKP